MGGEKKVQKHSNKPTKLIRYYIVSLCVRVWRAARRQVRFETKMFQKLFLISHSRRIGEYFVQSYITYTYIYDMSICSKCVSAAPQNMMTEKKSLVYKAHI